MHPSGASAAFVGAYRQCTKDLPDISREISLHNAEDSRTTDTVKPVKKKYPCTTQKILIELDLTPQ